MDECVITEPRIYPCVDPDAGLNYFLSSLTENRINGEGSYYQDKCLLIEKTDEPNNFIYNEVGSCSGKFCVLQEGYCSGREVKNIAHDCENGCLNGACLE